MEFNMDAVLKAVNRASHEIVVAEKEFKKLGVKDGERKTLYVVKRNKKTFIAEQN